MKKLQLDDLKRLSGEDFQASEKHNFVIIFDNIRSLHNVGSAFRTADAFRAEKIYLCGITGTPPNREINKTALGATESVAWEYHKDILILLDDLKKDGFIIIAIEQTNESTLLQNFIPSADKKYAFIFGNEVFGVDEAVFTKIDQCIEIPQFGTKHSLNVSVAVGVISWHFLYHSGVF